MVRLFAIIGCVLVCAGAAQAKDFVSVVLVGADGRSVVVRPPPRVIDGLFDLGIQGGARASAVGGYLKIYPITDGFFPGAPGRYYPASVTTCMSWNQAGARPDGLCLRATPALKRVFAASRRLLLFRAAPTSLRRLTLHRHAVAVGSNVGVGIDLAFARWRLRRPGAPSALCVWFQAAWRGPHARARPKSFCLQPAGVFATGWLYPLPRAVFELSLQYP